MDASLEGAVETRSLEGTVEQISFQQNYYFATSCPFFRHHLGGELLDKTHEGSDTFPRV